MSTTAEQVTAAVAEAACAELDEALTKIKHCLAQLTDDQVWRRPRPEMNSIGNLMLHLAGNLRQWIVSGIGGAKDARDRPAEFAEQGPLPRAELLARLESTVRESQAALRRLSPDELLRRRSIQSFDVSGAGAIFNSLPHFRGHTQEIIHMTRNELGAAYMVSWAPQTKEQGA